MREVDVPTVAKLLGGEWAAMLEREGVAPVRAATAGADGDRPPCPACGTAAPLVDGACSDCGIQLDDVAPKGDGRGSRRGCD